MCDKCMSDKSIIKTVWSDEPWGNQLKFAVPVESENVTVMDSCDIRIESLKYEVINYLKSQLEMLEDWKYFECPPETRKQVTTLKIVLSDIAKIFEKY